MNGALLLIVFGTVLFGIIWGYNQFDPSARFTKQVTKRLGRVGLGKDAGKPKMPSALDISGGQKSLIDSIAARLMPRPEKLRFRLARTGRDISMGRYLLLNGALVLIVLFIALTMFGQSWKIALCAGIVVGIGLPHKYIGRLIEKRNKAFLAQFPEAIDLVVRGVRSGLPIGESIKTIAKEMTDPIKAEFTIINDSMKLGQTVEQALWDCSNRLDLPEVKFFVIALSIQRETGGNLAETLENLSTILRQRRYMKLKIKAMSSEARASAMIIGSLPFIMFGILMAMNPKYISPLLTDPRGQILIGVGLSLIFTGNFIMRKLAQFKL